MILDSMKDRRPDLFPVHVTKPKSKRAGEGKARVARERTARYQNAMLALIFRPALLAEQAEKDSKAQQLASDGGFEVGK